MSRTFRYSADDDAVVQNAVAEGMFVNPSHFIEIAVKEKVDRITERYPHLAPIGVDDDRAA